MKPKFKVGQHVTVKGLTGTYKIKSVSIDKPNNSVLYTFEDTKDVLFDETFVQLVQNSFDDMGTYFFE